MCDAATEESGLTKHNTQNSHSLEMNVSKGDNKYFTAPITSVCDPFRGVHGNQGCPFDSLPIMFSSPVESRGVTSQNVKG